MVVIIVSEFLINITGRINNFNLPKNQPLLPLFEAIKIIREIKLKLMKTI